MRFCAGWINGWLFRSYSFTFVPLKKRNLKNRIIAFLDFFYPLFKGLMPLQAYRYAACGGGNTLLDILIYIASYRYLFKGKVVHTPLVAVGPHIAAFMVAFCISFPLGFYLNRTFVFTGSTLRGRVQLFRYFVLVVICILLNYIFLKLFVEQLHIIPEVSKLLTTVIVVSFSFVTQKYFTFKVQEQQA
jgi:Predicted membrane protein